MPHYTQQGDRHTRLLFYAHTCTIKLCRFISGTQYIMFELMVMMLTLLIMTWHMHQQQQMNRRWKYSTPHITQTTTKTCTSTIEIDEGKFIKITHVVTSWDNRAAINQARKILAQYMFRLAPHCTVGCLGLAAKVVWLLFFCVRLVCCHLWTVFFFHFSVELLLPLFHTPLTCDWCKMCVRLCKYANVDSKAVTRQRRRWQRIPVRSCNEHRVLHTTERLLECWVFIEFLCIFMIIADHHMRMCNAMMMCASVYLCACSLVPCRQSHDNLLAHWHIIDVRLGGLQFVRSFNDRWYENSRATNNTKKHGPAIRRRKNTHTPYVDWNSHRQTHRLNGWQISFPCFACV